MSLQAFESHWSYTHLSSLVSVVGSFYDDPHVPRLLVFSLLSNPSPRRGLDTVTCFMQIEYGKGDRLSFPRLDCKTVTLIFLTLSHHLSFVLWKLAAILWAALWRVPRVKEPQVTESWQRMRLSVRQPVSSWRSLPTASWMSWKRSSPTWVVRCLQPGMTPWLQYEKNPETEGPHPISHPHKPPEKWSLF